MAAGSLRARAGSIAPRRDRCASVIDGLHGRPWRASIPGVDLDPSRLRSFLAIVRYGGYHRGAEGLHPTQPAVSRHIRRLEEQLGESLFAKRGRGVELTPYGERAAAELAAGRGA